MDYQALKALLETHPNWPAVNDETLLAWVNNQSIEATLPELPNAKILAVILSNITEFSALSDGNKQLVRDILYVGDSVPTAQGEPAREALVSIFGVQSQTIQTLAEAISYQVSPAENIGILRPVRLGDVEFARTL